MKVYNKTRKLSEDYFECRFTEYDEAGNLIRRGTEDFSAERYNKQTKVYEIWTWDGRSVNKGGHKSFEKVNGYRVSMSTTPKMIERTYLTQAARCAELTGERYRIPAEIDVRRTH